MIFKYSVLRIRITELYIMSNWNTFFGPVAEGEASFKLLDEWFSRNRINYSNVIILTDSNVLQSCMSIFLGELDNIGETSVIEVEPGEKSKSIEILSELELAMLDNGADRKSLLISLGGGVVSDIGGLLSSTFMRGIDHIIIPTTFLAMIDASIGGKNGININGFKNLIGTFSSSKGVYIYPDFLDTLAEEDLISGFAEMIKHGMLNGGLLWNKCLELVSMSDIKKLIPNAIEVKIDIVQKDYFEKNGKRFFLNLGHTIAHAIEYIEDLNISHGNAVAAGLWIESEIAFQKGLIDKRDLKNSQSLIDKWWSRLNLDIQDLLKGMHSDKKKSSNSKDYNFSLWLGPGRGASLEKVTQKEIKKALDCYDNG